MAELAGRHGPGPAREVFAWVRSQQDLTSLLRQLRRREARSRSGRELTYRELAAKTGWSHAIIGQYLTGKVLPPTDRFDALIRILGAASAEQGALATARDRIEELRRTPSIAGGSRPGTGGLELFSQPRQFDAAPEPLVLVHHQSDRDARRAHLAGQGHGPLELGTAHRPSRDLFGEHPGDPGLSEGVQLGIQGLADGGRTGVPDPRVPRRLDTYRDRAGQLDPDRARAADRRGRHGEDLGQTWHEPEPGGVVLDGHLSLPGPARRPGRSRAGRHRAVVGLHPQEVVVAHPGIVSCVCFRHQVACTDL